MTRPAKEGKTERGGKTGEKDEFDETSDLCDFGYVLAVCAGAGPTATTKRPRDEGSS